MAEVTESSSYNQSVQEELPTLTATDESPDLIPPHIQCARCGMRFAYDPDAPRIRCPECKLLGRADASGRNLLGVGWDCLNCGAACEGDTNFCPTCAAGLPSRCLNCEHPVYTAICHNCGTHQAQMLHFQEREAERVVWMQLREEQSRQAELDILEDEDEPDITAARSAQPSRVVQSIGRPRLGFKRGRLIWGLTFMATGLLLVTSQVRPDVFANIGTLLNYLFSEASIWVNTQIAYVQTLDPQSPDYAYIFAGTLFVIAAVPVLLFVLYRLARRVLRI